MGYCIQHVLSLASIFTHFLPFGRYAIFGVRWLDAASVVQRPAFERPKLTQNPRRRHGRRHAVETRLEQRLRSKGRACHPNRSTSSVQTRPTASIASAVHTGIYGSFKFPSSTLKSHTRPVGVQPPGHSDDLIPAVLDALVPSGAPPPIRNTHRHGPPRLGFEPLPTHGCAVRPSRLGGEAGRTGCGGSLRADRGNATAAAPRPPARHGAGR